MKRIFSPSTIFLAVTILFSHRVNFQELTSPVDLVNPRIGGISHVLKPTFPMVHRPYGMVRFYPVTSPGISDSYLGGRIYGFPLNRPEHRSGAVFQTTDEGSFDLKNEQSMFGSEAFNGVREYVNIWFNR